ncbi:MAG: hypothetical protein JST26_01765 [Bacteroidetes bacterium]|nr:hypothetical protein [Bacteroidota bacterium]
MKPIYYIILLFIAGCSTKTERQGHAIAKDTVSEKPDKVISDAKQAIVYPDFDYIMFKSLADSLLSVIADEKIVLDLTIDTVKKTPTETGYYSYLLNQNTLLLKFNFYPGKQRSLLRFHVIQARYPDTLSLNKAFAALKEDASGIYFNKASNYHDNSPGLTYTNDYVIKADKQILWLNLPCPYSVKNLGRVKQIFQRSWHFAHIKDSINCLCGQSRCVSENKKTVVNSQ